MRPPALFLFFFRCLFFGDIFRFSVFRSVHLFLDLLINQVDDEDGEDAADRADHDTGDDVGRIVDSDVDA